MKPFAIATQAIETVCVCDPHWANELHPRGLSPALGVLECCARLSRGAEVEDGLLETDASHAGEVC